MSAPQLSLSLPPNTTSFKRSFEQFGFDLESPASTLPHPAIDGSAASSESSSSATSPDGDENRRKRARSASSLSDPEDRSSEASTSTLSSFDSESVSTDSQSNSSQAAARRHLLLDLGLGRGLGSSVALGLSMASTELQSGGRAIEPPPRIPTPELLENNDVDMPDIDMSFSRHEVEEGLASPAEHVRRSVDRFNAFDRHISVLRSSSPPVIPLPASLSSRQASLSPPTLPPLPLVDLGLDAEDDEEEDDHEQFPSTGSTNTTTSTPPRLDLNLPSTTSLSSGPNSPTVPRDESSSTQFRERLDSVIDGLGGGDLHFEAPTTYESATSADDRNRHNESPGATASGSNAPAGNFPIDAFAHRRPLVEFDWPPSALDWNMTLGQPGGSAEAAQSPPWRPARATAATDTAIADIRRFIGSSSPPPPRLYPRPASLAAPLSVPATSSRLDSPGLDSVDLVGAYLDFRNSTNSRAWETALDRARALHRERERERDRERERRERERELEREREREREEETERERDHPWSLDSIWETNPRGESSLSSALPRPWEALTRNRRELAAEGERELDLELARRRAMQRQLHLTLDRDRERQRDEQHARSQLATSVSRAERYLESGLVDPREASRPAPSTASLFDAPQAPERRLRPPSDTSNPFSVSWSSRRAREVEAEDPSSRPIAHRAMSSSQSELASDAWLDYLSRDRPSELDDFFHTEPASSRSTNPRSGPSSSVARDLPEYSRHGGETSASGDIWRARSTAVWQPRLAVSPQSTAQPTRTATHARAQSIATPTLSSMTAQPSIHRLRSRLYGPPRAAGVGSTNSLVAESAAAIRRREARSELMERLNRTISMDIDALSDPESDWEPFSTTPRASFPERNSGLEDEDMDSEEDRPHLPRRIADAIQHFESRSRPAARHSRALRFQREMEGNSPSRQSPPLSQRLSTGSIRSRSIPGRAPSEPEHEEQSAASSSGLNSRQPLSIHSRRPVSRRQHPISGEISPPPPASASVDRRHVSWEAPSRDGGVTSTYQYLSALSHGFDSQSLSISDLAHTIASNSNTETARSPPSPVWAENESPFSTLFARSAAPPRSTPTPRVRNMARTYSDDAIDALGDSSVPSLPPPDLGGNLDMLRSATAGARASSAVATPNAESSSTSHTTRPPTPPSTNPYTGPFRLTMQRRGEFARRSMESQRRIPDPPSIPPLHFGADFDNSSSSEERSDSRRRLLAQLSTERQSYEGRSERFADMERRLYNYPGPGPASSSHAQNSDSDPRRFFPSRPIPTSSGPLVDEEHLGHRYSARDMHNVLARQARLEGSSLTTDLPSPYRPSRDDTDGVDLSHDGFSTSRAHRLISRFHEQAEAEARESSSSSSTSPWAALPPRRSDTLRADAEARRRRVNATRTSMYDDPSTPFRHRASRDPSFHAMFVQHGPNARFRRRALGDYVRDEDFDGSYETLLSLSGLIGDVKPKATPDDVVAGLDTATYKDWATAESDQRCPICLDDYQPSDPVQKLGDCRHWLHKECLEQWLKGASTCPVCRKDVKGKGKARRVHHHHHHGPGPSRRRDDDGPGGSGGPSTGGGGSGGPAHYWLDFLRD